MLPIAPGSHRGRRHNPADHPSGGPLEKCSRKSHPDVQEPLYCWIIHNRSQLPLTTTGLLSGAVRYHTQPSAGITSRANPKLSAYAQVFRQLDFMATPMAPPRIHVLVHEKPHKRQSWASKGKLDRTWDQQWTPTDVFGCTYGTRSANAKPIHYHGSQCTSKCQLPVPLT
jgi:hypothetical protein